jgi:hypothetical protein
VKKKPSPLDMGLYGFLSLDILANRIIELGQRVEELQAALKHEVENRVMFDTVAHETFQRLGDPRSIVELACYDWTGIVRRDINRFTSMGFFNRLAWLLTGQMP